MRLTSPLFQPRFPFVQAEAWRQLSAEEAVLQIGQQAKTLGGRFSNEEATALVLAVETRFPAGADQRVVLWQTLLDAGLDPNARIQRLPPDFGWDSGHEPAYFAAQTAAEIEPFLARGADPAARDFDGREDDARLVQYVNQPQRGTLYGMAGERYSTDLRPRVEAWEAEVYGAPEPQARPRSRPGH